jgi:predicted kinase
MLIVFGGLPGTGKTTISRAVAARWKATYLRIDAIEQALRDAGIPDTGIGAAGYVVANALAEANLDGGRMVVADCVNPVGESREGWRRVASRSSVRLIEIEVICSDRHEHRRRVEGRTTDIGGLVPPTWEAVIGRYYEPWDRPCLIIDTTHLSPVQSISLIASHIGV